MSRAAVYTPATLAERWACSERKIRLMIERGELPAFRLGKLLRISKEAVESIECQDGASLDCEANSSSHGMTPRASGDVIDLEQMTAKKRSAAPRLDTHNSRAREARR